MDSIVKREARARRLLAKWDFRLQKTPPRHGTREHYGVGYQVLHGGRVVQGCFQREYEMTLEQVEDHVRGLLKIDLETNVQNALEEFVADGGNPADAASIGGELFDFVYEAGAA